MFTLVSWGGGGGGHFLHASKHLHPEWDWSGTGVGGVGEGLHGAAGVAVIPAAACKESAPQVLVNKDWGGRRGVAQLLAFF